MVSNERENATHTHPYSTKKGTHKRSESLPSVVIDSYKAGEGLLRILLLSAFPELEYFIYILFNSYIS